VGTDIQSIDEVRQSLSEFGTRYTDRLFTAHELECSGGSGPAAAPGLTARFAAKEAALKVLRPASVIPRWRSIEIVRDDSGACEIELHNEAAQLAEQCGVISLTVSMSHGAGVGLATVVAQLDPVERN
jgi:holo-[acyl-carrier protein] synthase